MQVLSRQSPATYVHGVRKALIEGVLLSALMGDIVLLDPWRRVHPVRLWAFGRAERYAKRTGKLKRVG